MEFFFIIYKICILIIFIYLFILFIHQSLKNGVWRKYDPININIEIEYKKKCIYTFIFRKHFFSKILKKILHPPDFLHFRPKERFILYKSYNPYHNSKYCHIIYDAKYKHNL